MKKLVINTIMLPFVAAFLVICVCWIGWDWWNGRIMDNQPRSKANFRESATPRHSERATS